MAEDMKEYAMKKGIDTGVLVVGGIIITALIMRFLGGDLIALFTAIFP